MKLDAVIVKVMRTILDYILNDLIVFEHVDAVIVLKRKLMNPSHCQEFGQLAYLASDWLFTQEPACLLQLLTMTTTHKFPSQVVAGEDNLERRARVRAVWVQPLHISRRHVVRSTANISKDITTVFFHFSLYKIFVLQCEF